MPDGCLLPRGSAPIKHRARRVARPARRGAPLGALGQVADHLDEFLSAVAVPAGEPDQAPGLGEDRTALRCPGDRDAPAAAELQQALVPEQVQGAQHGVLVHAEHRGEVLGQREPLARSLCCAKTCSSY